jgi:hypothetical protein
MIVSSEMSAPTTEIEKRSNGECSKHCYLDDCLRPSSERAAGGRRTWQSDPPASPRQLNVVSPAAWPRGTHCVQSSFLKIVVNFARMAVEVLGDNIAYLAEAGGGRNADVFTQVVKAFEYPQTHACIKSLQLAGPL